MVPVRAHKPLLGPDGQIVRKANGDPLMVRDRYRVFRANWLGYAFLAGAAVSASWVGFLVVFGVLTSIRQRPQPGAANGGPAAPLRNSGIGGGPPSVS